MKMSKAHGKDKQSAKKPSIQAKPKEPQIISQNFEILPSTAQSTIDPDALNSKNVLSLQRKVGNRAVDRLIAQRSHNKLNHLTNLAAQRKQKDRIKPIQKQGNFNTIQRKNDFYIGAVQEGRSLQDKEGGTGDTPGEWHAPGEGGYSRLMEGAAGEMVEDMVEAGSLSGLMLQHVAPDLSGIPAQQKKWSQKAADAKEEIDSLTFEFAPKSTRELHKKKYESASNQVEVIEKCGAELQQKAGQFNSFVPQGNGFFISAARLSSMQALLGATDNTSLAFALTQGLKNAEDVMKRYQNQYEDGNRKLTTEKLDLPEGDESVSQAAQDMTQASRELDAAYMGFQTTVLSGKIGKIKEEYAKDEARLKEIN
ncbi:MAG: hypothetical protein CSB13_03035, partial [Chloroflexi bacterium]